VTLRKDLPVFAVIGLFHLSDILFTIAGGYYEVLGLVVGASLFHWMLLGVIYAVGRKARPREEGFIVGP
jgi:hypothetical protein